MLETEVALWKPPANIETVDDELAALRAVPLFKDLRDADLRKVLKLVHVREYAADEVVFREGQTGAGMYIIQRGEVDIVMRLDDGSEMRMVTLHDRQFFGELALLETGARSATCVVRKPSVLLGLFQSDLEQLIERNSRLGARVIWNLARLTGLRLRELSDSVRASSRAKPHPAGEA
jgi:CRP/FNR family transcriptional regulator, cyclic AMP receptor protein